MAWTTLGTVAPGDVLRANSGTAAYNNVIGNLNEAPRGVVFRNTITANQSTISTVIDLTNFTATWTASSGRLYRTSVYVPEVRQNTVTGTSVFRLTDASNNDKQFADMQQVSGAFYTITLQLIETGLSGSITRKMRASTTAGTLDLLMASTSPGFILVEDLGSA